MYTYFKFWKHHWTLNKTSEVIYPQYKNSGVFSSFCIIAYKSFKTYENKLVCEYFVTKYILTGRSCQHLAQPPSWRTTPCRLSVTAYSIYLQLPSISEAVPPSTTWGCVMPWCKGPTYQVYWTKYVFLFSTLLKPWYIFNKLCEFPPSDQTFCLPTCYPKILWLKYTLL